MWIDNPLLISSQHNCLVDPSPLHTCHTSAENQSPIEYMSMMFERISMRGPRVQHVSVLECVEQDKPLYLELNRGAAVHFGSASASFS